MSEFKIAPKNEAESREIQELLLRTIAQHGVE